jgi:hypothetical protein
VTNNNKKSPNGVSRQNLALLYQKDPDSKDFPLTEIKRALRRFGLRKEFTGMEPAMVLINPAHANLIQMSDLEEFGLTLEFADKVSRHYIWLTGRLKANGVEPGDENTEDGW